MVAIRVSRLLSTICSIAQCALSYRAIFISFYRFQLYSYLSFLKLVIKPDSLLLEDRGSETSSEGHDQTSSLLLIE